MNNNYGKLLKKNSQELGMEYPYDICRVGL